MTTPAAPGPPRGRRYPTAVIVAVCVLAPVLLIGLVVGGTYTVMALWKGESADSSVALIDSAPVPEGAVLDERTSSDGDIEIGPRARVAYHLGDTRSVAENCGLVVDLLRADGWSVRTYGQDSRPLPDDVTPVCATADEALVLTASRAGSEVSIGVVIRPASGAPGTDLAYSADGS